MQRVIDVNLNIWCSSKHPDVLFINLLLLELSKNGMVEEINARPPLTKIMYDLSYRDSLYHQLVSMYV